jgi:hypothetical protein
MYILLVVLGIICVMLPFIFNYLEGMDVPYADDREKVDELPKFTNTPQEREELERLIKKT